MQAEKFDWLNLQSTHDLSATRPDHQVEPLIVVGM
jgi:hypothetical protein